MDMLWIVLYLGVIVVLWCYLFDCFVYIVCMLVNCYGCLVLVIGVFIEVELVQQVCLLGLIVGQCVLNLVGVFMLGELVVFIEGVVLLVFNNSGFVYLVVVMQILVVDFYVLINLQYMLWVVLYVVFLYQVFCCYCYCSVCLFGYQVCLIGVMEEEVVVVVYLLWQLLCVVWVLWFVFVMFVLFELNVLMLVV